METKCYAMVRGSGIRVTGLGARGELPSPIQYATSKSIANVTLNEITDAGGNEILRTDENDERRMLFVTPDKTIRYTADISFLRADPGVLSLVAGVPLVTNASGDIVGFDSKTRRPAAAFALEVWSKLAGQRCSETGAVQWGYTVLPFLRGGYLSGFSFANGLVSFNLKGAQTRKDPRWGVGPYDLEGKRQRLLSVVSRNAAYRTQLTTAIPPVQAEGIKQTTDVAEGGYAVYSSGDTEVIEGGNASGTSPWIVEGGRAL